MRSAVCDVTHLHYAAACSVVTTFVTAIDTTFTSRFVLLRRSLLFWCCSRRHATVLRHRTLRVAPAVDRLFGRYTHRIHHAPPPATRLRSFCCTHTRTTRCVIYSLFVMTLPFCVAASLPRCRCLRRCWFAGAPAAVSVVTPLYTTAHTAALPARAFVLYRSACVLDRSTTRYMPYRLHHRTLPSAFALPRFLITVRRLRLPAHTALPRSDTFRCRTCERSAHCYRTAHIHGASLRFMPSFLPRYTCAHTSFALRCTRLRLRFVLHAFPAVHAAVPRLNSGSLPPRSPATIPVSRRLPLPLRRLCMG